MSEQNGRPDGEVPTSLSPFIAWPIACIPTLFALRDVAPEQTPIFVAIAGGANLLALVATIIRRRCKFLPEWQLIATLYVLFSMAVLAIIHGVLGSESLLGLILLYVSAIVCGVTCLMATEHPGPIVRLVVNSLGVLVMASTTLWLLGVQSLSEGGLQGAVKSTLSAYGIFGERALFPLTFGYTSHAAICGAVVVGLAPRLKEWTAWPMLACALTGLVLSDGRTAMMAVVLVALVWRFVPPGIMRYAAFVLPFSAALFLFMVTALPDELLSVFARTGYAEEIRSGNERIIVWQRVVEAVVDDPLSFVFGYGFFGQAASGVSRGYSFLFTGWTGDARFYTVHNAGMQLLLDGGIPAVVVFCVFYWWMLDRYAAQWVATRSRFALSALNLLAFVLIVGATDTTGTPIQREIFFALLLLGFATLRVPHLKSEVKTRQLRQPAQCPRLIPTAPARRPPVA